MIRLLSLQEAQQRFSNSDLEEKILKYPFTFERAHFIYEKSGEIAGRIAANLSLRDSSRGYLGFFECDPKQVGAKQIAQELLRAAELWLKEKGVKVIYGPVNYSTLFQYRFELNRQESPISPPAFFWEPTQPEEYPLWFQDCGYRIADEYHSRAFSGLQEILPKSQARFSEARKLGFSTRPLDFKNQPEHELKMLARINALSFEESFLAEPFDEKAYVTLVVPQFYLYLSEFSFFLLSPAGEEVGYFFLFPENGYLIWKTLAILPEYQGSGLASFGIHHALSLAQSHQIQFVVSALIRKGAGSEQLLKRGETFQIWEHRYAVFSKLMSD